MVIQVTVKHDSVKIRCRMGSTFGDCERSNVPNPVIVKHKNFIEAPSHGKVDNMSSRCTKYVDRIREYVEAELDCFYKTC